MNAYLRARMCVAYVRTVAHRNPEMAEWQAEVWEKEMTRAVWEAEQAKRREALEEAARICDERASRLWQFEKKRRSTWGDGGDYNASDIVAEAEECAEAIRDRARVGLGESWVGKFIG